MTAKRIETVRQHKRRLAARVAAARERGRKLVEAARARARKLVEVARARARKFIETARGPKVRPAVKKGPPKGTSIAERVRTAYAALREETGLRNVAIADLQQRSRVPRGELLEYLRIECLAHRANPTLGEPTAATKAELEHALQIGGRAYIYVELLEGTSFADQVLSVVRSDRPQKFGSKAFIASVWRVGFAPQTTIADFKEQLLAAHRSGDLELARADFIKTSEPMYARSEIKDGRARYHFILPEPRRRKL